MILDQQNLFDNPSAAITATAVSGNIIDLLNAHDIGIGDNDLEVLVQVGTTFTTTNAGTLQVQFQGSTDNSTYTTYAETPAIAVASLVAGTRLAQWAVPGRSPLVQNALGLVAIPRYLRLNYVVANAFTAGTVIAGLVIDRQDQTYYPPGLIIAN